MKKLICRMLMLATIAMMTVSVVAQPNYRKDIQKEKLNRGVVAVKTNEGRVAVSWRLLGSDQKDVAFDVFRNGEKLALTLRGSYYWQLRGRSKDKINNRTANR